MSHPPHDPDADKTAIEPFVAPATGSSVGADKGPEKSPGVYVRPSAPGDTALPGHDELDLLWAPPRNKHNKSIHQREERHPVFMFVAGLGTGVLVTLLAFVVFVNRPLPPSADQAAMPNSPLTAPIERLQSAVLQGRESTQEEQPSSEPMSDRGRSRVAVPDSQDRPLVSDDAPESEASATASAQGGRVYEVVSGDTLGSIAGKVYGSTDPALIEKIQRANDMKNPHDLSLGQKLVIPPKSY